MARVFGNITELIGSTPLVRLSKYAEACGLRYAPLAKLEGMNPAGSVKDRTALFMINDAEQRGVLREGGTIVEPTSGNTGVGLAMIGRVKGYKVILTMPDTMSQERINLLRAYGAEVILTKGEEGMTGSIQKAEELERTTEGAVILSQFDNPSNPESHYQTTAEEILADTDGNIDAFIAGIGTGGTLCGTARKLKEKKDIYIIGVEPASSPMITEGRSGQHKLQGIGANFVPANYNPQVVDEVMPITNEDAISAARMLRDTEGILCGFSGGAALAAAKKVLERENGQKKIRNVVVLLPDGGERYLSTELYR